jgi:hypothetical protein
VTAPQALGPVIGDWPVLDGAAAGLAPALLDWASRDDPACPRLCLVTGGRGTGKSRLLAWLLAGSDSHPATTVHATVPARGQIALTLAWEIGRQLGYGPTGPGELLERVEADPRPLRVIIPDLHLAGRGPADLPAADPRTVVAELLAPLLSLPGVRAAVEVERAELFPGPGRPLVLALPQGAPAFTRPDPWETEPDRTDPRATAGVRDWEQAPAAVRETALDRAVRQGTGSVLLTDPGYLAHGSAAAITAALADSRIAVPRSLRTVWASAGPVLSSAELSYSERAAVLHAAAVAVDPPLAEYLRPRAEQHSWTARWTRAELRTAGLTLDQGSLLVVDLIGRLHEHDPADGRPVARRPVGPGFRPVHIAAVGARRLLAVDAMGRLQLVPAPGAAPGTGAADPFPDHLRDLVLRHNAAVLAGGTAPVTAVAADRGNVAVADAGGGFQLWSAEQGTAGARSHRAHRVPVTAISCLVPPGSQDGLCLVVTGAGDGTVRLWDSRTGRSMPEPVERRNALPTALALADTGAGLVLAVAWSDRRLHLWRLSEGRVTFVPLVRDVDALALTGDGLLVCGGTDGAFALALDLDTL